MSEHLATIVRPFPWQCDRCGHHQLAHWWNTADDPAGTSPGNGVRRVCGCRPGLSMPGMGADLY